MKTFYVWATLLTKDYYPHFLTALVEKRYSVSALASTGKVYWDCDGSVLVSLNLSIEETSEGDRKLDAAKVNDEVRVALDGIKAQYHSIITFQVGASCSWYGGNIKFPPKIPKEQPLEIRGNT